MIKPYVKELQQSDKYLQTFSLLAKYGFLTPEQFETVCEHFRQNIRHLDRAEALKNVWRKNENRRQTKKQAN